ncbi:MAG: helix-turn-helix domain-containing protein [Candidatus Thiodiazotropha endolucinida]|nr:helix-turn-helix domain-containing protein [Candidatus Thiodiazotropha endolucinida]
MNAVERLAWLQALNSIPGIKPAMLKVSIAFAYRYNFEAGLLNPSIPKIANDTGLDSRSVYRAIAELERLGAISVERLLKRVNHYTFIPLTEMSPLTEASDTPDRDVTKPLTSVSPKQGNKQGSNRRNASSDAVTVNGDLFSLDGGSSRKDSKRNVPPCPHSEIIQIYHESLPELPRVAQSRWHGSVRAKNLETRWKEDSRHQQIEFWEWFFQTVKTNPHWMGENGWKANLGWLLKRENFDKVIDRGVNAQGRGQ